MAQTILRDNVQDVWKSLVTSYDDSGINRLFFHGENSSEPFKDGWCERKFAKNYKLQKILFQAGELSKDVECPGVAVL